MSGYKYTQDARLANGSIIRWSQRTKQKVPVQCGNCSNERWLYIQNVTVEHFTGICSRCSRIASRIHTEIVTLDTGSVIYWNERNEVGRDQKVPVQCGICGGIRPVAASKIPHSNFTGYCVDCAPHWLALTFLERRSL